MVIDESKQNFSQSKSRTVR